MKLLLVRHAEAHPGSPDALRTLTEKGRGDALQLGRVLGPQWPEQGCTGLHSTLVRARETAECMTESGRLAVTWHALPGLEPEAGCRTALEWIRLDHPWLVLVGHNPHLTLLAHRLLGREAGPLLFEMKKCSALLLQREYADSDWHIQWFITAKLGRARG